MIKTPYGVQKHQEVSPDKRFRDLRPISARLREWMGSPEGLIMTVSAAVLLMALLPVFAELLALIVLGTMAWATTVEHRLPARVPRTAHLPDPGDPRPNGTPRPGQGSYFYGNEIGTDKEIWFKPEDVGTHTLVFGTTGAGKTETLLSFAYNAVVQGSGFIIIDGKGDNRTAAKIYSMLRSVGREDDLLVMNFMTAGQDSFGRQRTRLTNRCNPFQSGNAAALTKLVVSLMDNAGSDPIWKSRAMALIDGLMTVLVYRRDRRNTPLDADAIRSSLTIQQIMALERDPDLPDTARKSLRAYFDTLPDFDINKPYNQQSETANSQHGFLSMQFTRVFGMLADTYAHIFRTAHGEIDFADVILNRRVLLVSLPSLEIPPDELASLGKIVITLARMMMASGLGNRLEGTYREIIEARPTMAEDPFPVICDEYGYYITKGASVIPAQARALNVAMVFAGQAYSGFKQNDNQEEAEQTVGNCNIKCFMKVEDPFATNELYVKSAGQALVSEVGGFENKPGLMGTQYVDQQTASLRMQDRGDWLDLKTCEAGEMRIVFKDALIRARSFFVDPTTFSEMEMRLNHFIAPNPVGPEILEQDRRDRDDMSRRLHDLAYWDEVVAGSQLPLTWGLWRMAWDVLAGSSAATPTWEHLAAAAAWARDLPPADMETLLADETFTPARRPPPPAPPHRATSPTIDVFTMPPTPPRPAPPLPPRPAGPPRAPPAALPPMPPLMGGEDEMDDDTPLLDRDAVEREFDALEDEEGAFEDLGRSLRDATAYPRHRPDENAADAADILTIIDDIRDGIDGDAGEER